jgi:hypothetical protein
MNDGSDFDVLTTDAIDDAIARHKNFAQFTMPIIYHGMPIIYHGAT